MITPQQFRNPQVKPKWQASVGIMESVVAYNCRKYGFPLPVLALPMWEGAGNRALDYSGHGNHGGLESTTKWIANGVDVNGTTDYVDILESVAGGHAFADVGERLSIAMKIYPHVVDAAASAAGWSAENVALELRTQTSSGTHVPFNLGVGNNKIQFGVTDDHVNGADLIESTSTISTDTWYNVCIVVDGDDYNIYIDRNLDKSGTFVDAIGDRTVGSTICNMQIGTRTRNAGEKDSNLFNGFIDHAGIFNVALTAAQVKFLYDNPYFMYEIPEELYGYVAAIAAEANPYWYYQMLKRRN